jgi:hypothetical protein
VQNDSHFSNFGQLDFVAVDWRGLKLRKQERPILTKLFETGEPVTSVSHGIESSIQSTQYILENLRMHISRMWKPFFSFSQIFLLDVVVGIGYICWNNVFRLQGASIYGGLPRIDPVFTLCQGIVINAPTGIEPGNHTGFLLQRWVNSVPISHSQHTPIVAFLGNCRDYLENVAPINWWGGSHPDALIKDYSAGLPAV